MPQDTRIALFLMGELVAALRANDPDAFRQVAVWWGARPRGVSGGGTSAGLAVFVPDRGRAGQAAWLAPGGKPLNPVTAVLLHPCDVGHRGSGPTGFSFWRAPSLQAWAQGEGQMPALVNSYPY